MFGILKWGVGVVVVAVAGVAFAVYSSVQKLRKPDLPELKNGPEMDQLQFAIQRESGWVRRLGFEWVGAFKFEGLQVAAWKHDERATYFCKYIHPSKAVYDFVTPWGESRALTTGSTRDSFTLPAPNGWHLQAFEGLSLEELYARHQQGVEFLRQNRGYGSPKLPSSSFSRLLTDKIKEQAEYVASKPLYPLQGVYWYFVRRGAMVDKPIEDLDLAA